MRTGPLRGRAEPMARALSALRATRQHGSGSLLLVSGPPGIGKTALLSEICQQATHMEFRVAAGKCDQIEQVWPGAPVIALLRAGRDPLLAADDYEKVTRLASEPLLLADRIAAHLEAAALTRPLLIAIDDLQWADRVSTFALRIVTSRLIGLPVAWVLASRDGAPGAEAQLAGAAQAGPDLGGAWLGSAEHIRLGPLSGADLAAFARDRLGHEPDERMRQFLATTDGNPFFAAHIIDAGAEDTGDTGAGGTGAGVVAAGFSAAIARRVGALPGPSRDLVQLLAVAGHPLPVPDAAALAGAPQGWEQAMADVVGSGLVARSGDALAFRHDLVREAIYATLPAARATHLHRAFAEYYLSVAGSPVKAASHAREAATPGDVDSAAILIAAAETLAPASARDAGELAALAFRTVPPGHPQWLGLALRCLRVLCQAQRPADAITVADLIVARTDDGDAVGLAETQAARALWLNGRVSELAARAGRVLRTTGLNAASTARLRAAQALAATRLATGDVAAREAAAALEGARSTGDREALALALQAAGEASRNEARHQAALRHFRELREVTGLSFLAEEITALQFLDRYDHAQALLDDARASRDGIAARGAGALSALLPAMACAQLWQDFNLGRLDDADSGARVLIELGQELGVAMYAVDAIIIRAGVALLRGQAATAAGHLRSAGTLSGGDHGPRRPDLAVMHGWLAATRGGLEAAVRELRPVLDGASPLRSYWPLWPCWNGLFFEIGTLAADPEFSAACVDIAEVAAARNPGVASFEGVALNVRGRIGKDLDTVAESAGVLARSPRPVLRALGAETYGRALLAAGQRSPGLAQLDLAWDEYHEMGAWGWRAEVQRAMREAGVRLPKWSAAVPRPESGWSALTEAEHRVAALIGAGHTNKSAASELGVSVNTVGTHLRAVFAKLGIQSRVQLANELHKETER